MSRAAHEARCVAPLGDADAETPLEQIQICGEPATEVREVEGIACPLCAAHAAEIDAETRPD